MSSYLKHLETITLPGKFTLWFSCDVSENDQISIITANSLFIFQICALKDNTLPVVSMKKLFIQPTQFALSSNVDLDINTFYSDLPKDSLYEAVLRTDLSTQLKEGSSVESKIIKIAWSPSQLIDNYDCAIATLTNTGSLEIFIKVFDNSYYEDFICLSDITRKFIELCKGSWNCVDNFSAIEKYEELKKRVEQIKATAFTWSNIIHGRVPYSILIVAHANGILTFWKVISCNSRDCTEDNVTFMNQYNTYSEYISTLKWTDVGNKALLIFGNKRGKLKILQASAVHENEVLINGEINLLAEEDDIKVEQLNLLTYDNYIFIIVVKGSDLIIFLINSLGKNIDNCVFHVGNFAITGLMHIGENKFLVVSLSGATKEFKLNCVGGKINIEWRHIYANLNFYINETLSVVSSRNNIIFGFLTGPCKTADAKEDKDLNELVLFYNTQRDPLEILLKNNSESFRNYRDCLEVLRLNSILEKQFCSKKLFEEINNTFTFYNIKLHLWVSKIYENVSEQTTNMKSIKSYDDNVLKMTIWMAVHRMTFLLSLYENGQSLSTFQLQNLYVLNNYLKQVVLDDTVTKLELDDKAITDIIKVMSKANEIEYSNSPICTHCGEKIMGLSCFPPHFDMRCAVSFMQIERFPAYKCLFCKCVVHENIGKEVNILICPFCDIPMAKSLLKPMEIDQLSNIDKKPSVFCKSDCLIDVIKLNSIEQQAFKNIDS